MRLAPVFLPPLLLVAAIARADATSDLEALLNENVVAGVSKKAETAGDAPATVSILTAEDMQRFGMRSINEAINFLAMGFVTQDPLHSVEIGGRGVLLTGDFGNHVLVLVDGHSINEQWDGTAYFEQGLGIPMEIIDHVELILGPGSVLYGGTAMLGVINVVTKSARGYKGLHLIAEGSASPGQDQGRFTSFAPNLAGGAYRLGAGTGLTTSLLGKPLTLTGQIEMYAQNGPSFTWAPEVATQANGTPLDFGPKTPLGVWGGTTHAEYYTQVPTAYVRATYGEFAVGLHAEAYKRATPAPGFGMAFSNFDDPSSYELDRWIWGDVRYDHRFGERTSFMARLYADAYDYQQHLEVDDPSYCTIAVTGGCINHVFGASRWGGLELQETQDWLGNDHLTTMFGTEARVRWIAARTDIIDGATNQTVGTVGDKTVTEVPLGVYLQQRWMPVGRLQLNAGARFDHDPRGGDHLSPRAAATFEPWKGGILKGIYSEAFRSPTFYEYYYQAPGQLPNAALKSETVRSVEASLEETFGPNRILFGVFRSWWDDMVQLTLVDAASGVYQYQNASSIDNYGFNGRFDATAGALRLGMSVTGAYTRRTTCAGTVPLTVAPSIFGNARLSYSLPGELPTIALAASVVGPRLADRALDGGFPVVPVAPTNVELRLTFSGPVPEVRGLSYRVSGDYSTASVNPYVAGPNQTVSSTDAPAELTPINRLTLFATLQYDLFQ